MYQNPRGKAQERAHAALPNHKVPEKSTPVMKSIRNAS